MQNKKTDEPIKVFKFVVQEFNRLAVLMRTDRKKAFDEIGVAGLIAKRQNSVPAGLYACGKTARLKLFGLAKDRINSDPELKDRVRLKSYVSALEDLIVQRLFVNREPVTKDVTKGILRCAKVEALKSLEDRTYLFPVYLFWMDSFETFLLGSIKFSTSKRYLSENEAAMKRSIEDAIQVRLSKKTASDKSEDDTWFREYMDDLYQSARKHYERYPWIAEVSIPSADPEVGWQRARKVLEQTLNTLRLIVRSSKSHFIGLADECYILPQSNTVSVDMNGFFYFSKSMSFVQPKVKDDVLKTKGFLFSSNIVVRVIEKYRRNKDLSLLERRLFSSLFWYGEAWKELEPRPKLVKFVICLESLVMTGEREGLVDKLAERVAIVCTVDLTYRKKIYEHLKEIYDARSSAAHGSGDYSDEKLTSLNRKAEKIAVWAIYGCAELFFTLGSLTDPEKTLREFFLIQKLSTPKKTSKEFMRTLNNTEP